MLKIRLSRTGKKGQPQYRFVVCECRSRRDGKNIDTLGTYNPLTNPSTIKLDKTAYASWITKGAQPTNTVRLLAKKA